MAGAVDSRDERSNQVSERLKDGLKSCRNVVESYAAMLRQQTMRPKRRD